MLKPLHSEVQKEVFASLVSVMISLCEIGPQREARGGGE